MPISALDRATPLFRRLSFLCSAIYFMTVPLQFPGRFAVKGLAIASLAAIAWVGRAWMLWFALVASAVGDVLLDLDRGRLFIPGLCAFLVAHVVYTGFFASRWPIPPRLSLPQIVLLPLILAYAAAFGFWLAPELATMHLIFPVMIYICVIATMVITSVGAKLSKAVPIGAFLFLISDSLLAIAKFKEGSFALRDYLVWGTYYGAQYFITTGVLRSFGLSSN